WLSLPLLLTASIRFFLLRVMSDFYRILVEQLYRPARLAWQRWIGMKNACIPIVLTLFLIIE
ncbi:MAG: hypothetical protein AAB177_17370, partial [Nitrospirota bacterium]